jgi:hypothetical protein
MYSNDYVAANKNACLSAIGFCAVLQGIRLLTTTSPTTTVATVAMTTSPTVVSSSGINSTAAAESPGAAVAIASPPQGGAGKYAITPQVVQQGAFVVKVFRSSFLSRKACS